MKEVKTGKIALLSLMICSMILAPFANPHTVTAKSNTQTPSRFSPELKYDHHLQEIAETGYFVLRSEGAQVVCHDALPEEIQLYNRHDPNQQLHILNADDRSQIQPQAADGLTIMLRGTAQLEANAPAKAAFIQAANTWQTLVKSPITIFIDIDFGTTRFGEAYPEGVIGATRTQSVGSATIYADARQGLINSAKSQQETNIYNALPQGSVPTELGSTTGITAPTSVFRSIGLLNANADVASEVTQLGTPPAIGFNSAVNFDFDPSDGIDADKIDFYGVALHEIGHVLGFSSNVGVKELSPLSQVALTTWDLFRFRPGVTTNSFSMAPRVLSSGGEHAFFAGGTELSLSTGRPDGTGGDGRQSSHWRDDSFTEQYLGIMEPTAKKGQQLTITQNDLDALEFLGHSIGSVPPPLDDTILLASGSPQTGSMTGPSQGQCLLNFFQYAIAVPNGATQLKIDLNGVPELDLFVRLNQRIVIQSGQPLRDFTSSVPGGNESITITPATTPALQSGTYFIAIGNCGSGAGNFTITATVSPTGGGGGGGGGGAGSAPVINSLSSRLDGDALRLTGTAADADGDLAKIQTKLLDSAGGVVSTSAESSVNFGATPAVNFTVSTSGMTQVATLSAVKVELILIDSKGNRSTAATADFNQADSGGVTIRSAAFDPGGVMIMKGSSFTSPAELEINGVIVTPPLRAKVKSESKIKIGGTAAELGLRTGVNRVRLRTGNLYSNLYLLSQ
jgi:hypothetical protein